MTDSIRIKIDEKQTIDVMLQQILNQALFAIDAESGSLMLTDHDHENLQIKARLGKPSTRLTDPVFKIGDSSIAGYVAETGKPYICTNVETDPRFAYSRSGALSFKSLISIPIFNGETVTGVINADDIEADKFNIKHQNFLIQIAKQASTPIAERISHINILDNLYEVGAQITHLPTKGGVEAVLTRIAQAAIDSLKVDLVTLYQYDQAKDDFLVEGSGPTIQGKLNHYQPMRHKVHKGDVPWTVVKENKFGFYVDIREHTFLTNNINRKDGNNRNRFVDREGICSMAVLPLSFRAGQDESDEIFGVMFANYRSLHHFTEEEKKTLRIFANFAAVSIKNIRYEELKLDQRRVLATKQIAIAQSITANFAHKMNNVSGTIPVDAQLIINKLQKNRELIDPGLYEYIEKKLTKISSDNKMMTELAARLSRPYREGKILGEISSININMLIEKLCERYSVSNDIEFNISLNPDLPNIDIAEFQIEEVLVNLINNSIYAVANTVNKEISITTNVGESGFIEVVVTDSGPGIPPEIFNGIFTPGRTTKKEKGFGLGLWWCRTYMQAIGGDLVLENNIPAIFLLKLPLHSK